MSPTKEKETRVEGMEKVALGEVGEYVERMRQGEEKKKKKRCWLKGRKRKV